MSKSESFKLFDIMEAIAYDKYGNVKQTWVDEDLITNAGKVSLAGIITSDVGGVGKYNWIAVGTGTLAASASQTALRGQKAILGATGTRTTTTASGDTAQFVTIFRSGLPTGLNGTSTGSKAIQETGVFNAAAAGTMLCRQTFGPFSLDWNGGDALQITWKIKFA